MNNLKKDIKRKVKSIIRAAQGKPIDKITIGVEVTPCSKCKYRRLLYDLVGTGRQETREREVEK